MGIINILDAETSNRIAAGEVVERPSSAVKELLENSLDAGAQTVTLELRDGGKSMVRVTDDGCGFLRDDMPKALLRHATSKLESGSEIAGIRSLGFRGEALAAISSVSRLEIISKHRSETLGTLLISDENGIVMSDTGCPDGTTVIMRDIYYNTPARLKFLKRDATEGSSCVAFAEKLALSHPGVSFTVVSDGEKKFFTPGDGKLLPALYALYGREFASSLVPISNDLDGVSVRGYVSPPEEPRGSRAMQSFFINGRYVKSRTVQAALEEGFRSYIPRGKFPAGIVFLILDPENVDVNVHPAKTEVKFSSEQSVFRAVYYAVRNAFADNAPSPEAQGDEEPFALPEQKETIADETKTAVFSPLEKKTPGDGCSEKPRSPETTQRAFAAFRPDIGVSDLPPRETKMLLRDSEPLDEKEIPEQQTIEEEKPRWRMIGQAYDAYIFVETENEILVIDKHAAHERMLYESLSRRRELGIQTLLTGVPVTVGRENAALLLADAKALAERGFEIEDFGNGSVIVRSVPMSFSRLGELRPLLELFASELSEGNSLPFGERVDRALYTVACKAALKAGIKNSATDDLNIAEAVMNDPSLRVCPHGRPFIYRLARREIEKHFDR